MRKLVWIPIVLALTFAIPTAAERPVDPVQNDCLAEYGCGAEILTLTSEVAGNVLYGWARIAMKYPDEVDPPAVLALVVRNGDVVQKIPIRWVRVDYVCCCPAEWYGEFAAALPAVVQPHDMLTVVIGTTSICETKVVVPWDPLQ